MRSLSGRFFPPPQLHLHVGTTRLVDQFEWDLNNPDNNPEEFAERLCADLGLGGEYVSAFLVTHVSAAIAMIILPLTLIDGMKTGICHTAPER